MLATTRQENALKVQLSIHPAHVPSSHLVMSTPSPAMLLPHDSADCESPAYLHDKGLLGSGKVCQQVQVQGSTKIVRVGDEQVLDAALDQTIQHARAQQGRIDVTMTWRTPANRHNLLNMQTVCNAVPSS